MPRRLLLSAEQYYQQKHNISKNILFRQNLKKIISDYHQ